MRISLSLLTSLTLLCCIARADEPAPPLLRLGEQDTALNLINAGRKQQELKRGIADGRDAARIVWNAQAATLVELELPSRPLLLAFGQGVSLEIDVHNGDFPKLTGSGVRLIDANDVTWQFGGLSIRADEPGWQTLKVDLATRRGVTSWGGKPEDRAAITPPVRLFQILFNAPEKPDQPRSIALGDIRRNPVDLKSIGPEVPLEAVTLALRTALPVAVVEKGGEDAAVFRASNPVQGLPAAFRLHLVLTDYEGEKHEWTSTPVRLAPGASVDIPFGAALSATGWWRVQPSLLTVEGTGRVARGERQLAYLEPVGPRTLPPEENFWFAVDSRYRTPEMFRLLASVGVDMLRHGSWRSVNSGENRWQWAQYEAEVRAIQAAGMQTLFSITFTPDDAAKPEYVQRRAAKEKIGGRNINLSNVAPRSEVLREAVRTMAEHNKALGLSIYDLWNEPDLSGFWQGTTDEYLEFMRICYETVKSVQPEATMLTGGIATMSGHGGHGLNPDLIERLIVEAQDRYDAISVHQHGDFRNFQQGLDGVLAAHRATLRTPKPLWFTETGFNGDPRQVAQVLVQKHALARARGAEGFVWYALYPPGRGGGYGMVDGQGSPNPVLPAYNEMVRQFRGKRFVRQQDAGPGNWLFTFEGGGETLFVAWNEDAAATGRREWIRLGAEAKVRLLNVMGRDVPLERFENLAILPLERDVRYLIVSGGAEVVGAPVDMAERPRGGIGDQVPVTARLFNPLSRAAAIKLRWTLPDGTTETQQADLAAGAHDERRITLAIPAAAAGDVQPEVILEYEMVGTPVAGRLALDIESVRRIPAEPIVSREPDFVMVARDHIQNPNEADPTRTHLAWAGADDLSAKVWLGLEKSNLIVRIDVTDDRHVQPHAPDVAWQSDSVQFALRFPERSGNWEFAISRTDDGIAHAHAAQVPTGLSRDYAATLQVSTTPRAGGMRYEVRLPLTGLGTDAAALVSQGLAFNLIVNDDDGAGRKGFAFVAPGLGIRANSDRWPRLAFTPPAPF